MNPAEHGVHEVDVDVLAACFDLKQLPFDVGQVVPRFGNEFGQQFGIVKRHANTPWTPAGPVAADGRLAITTPT
jgi:hypothetical protein